MARWVLENSNILLIIIAQHQTEAPSNPSMTSLTTKWADQNMPRRVTSIAGDANPEAAISAGFMTSFLLKFKRGRCRESKPISVIFCLGNRSFLGLHVPEPLPWLAPDAHTRGIDKVRKLASIKVKTPLPLCFKATLNARPRNRRRLELRQNSGGNPPRLAARDNGYSDFRGQKHFATAPDFLHHINRGAPSGGRVRLDAKLVVHQGGFEKLDGHGAHHEMKGVRPAVSKNPPVLYTERAEKLGPAAFKETQIGG